MTPTISQTLLSLNDIAAEYGATISNVQLRTTQEVWKKAIEWTDKDFERTQMPLKEAERFNTFMNMFLAVQSQYGQLGQNEYVYNLLIVNKKGKTVVLPLRAKHEGEIITISRAETQNPS